MRGYGKYFNWLGRNCGFLFTTKSGIISVISNQSLFEMVTFTKTAFDWVVFYKEKVERAH